MAQRLKRWESPRREGRNDKGKGGTARQRQLRKQRQTLIRKLKDQSNQSDNPRRRERSLSSFLYCVRAKTYLFERRNTLRRSKR